MSVLRRLSPAVFAAVFAAGLLTAVPTPAGAATAPVVVKSAPSEPGRPAYAVCPSGTVVTGGGYFMDPAVNADRVVDFVIGDAPASPTSWAAHALRGRIIAYAMCAPGNTHIAHSPTWSAPGQPTTAVCPDGTRLTAGGYAAEPRTNTAGENVDALVANSPADQPANAWGAGLKYGRAVAYAVCNR
ncbi:hypothetical protein [Embleya hyalina]|uniref:Secreted protein n=1 Tax=Embleya hyalina TaxID=516124 RepID=A0A401Z6W9_9ACTN|nr:hypothetical protein [Embleya hyalina]GCE02607.1 hypothetical protein EHYA_10384 [Embleya hyalina]